MIWGFDLFPTGDFHLLAHNVLFLGGGFLNLVFIAFVLVVRRKNLDNTVMTFAATFSCIAVFQFSHVLGVNAPNAEISRQIFMFNICIVPLMVFMSHWFFTIIGITKTRRSALAFIYLSGAALFIIHALFPSTYLLASVPKLYLPFYYVPGSLQWLTRVWFHGVAAYCLWLLLQAYNGETDPIKKNRYLFVLLATVIGFMLGETAVLLVYDIPFDPLWSAIFGMSTFVFAYAILKYQLLDVKVIVQRALIYGIAVAATICLILFAEYSNAIVHRFVPELPIWITPLISALVATTVGFFIWRKLREGDELKYEFITVIAHKFRTPLTQTKWAAEELYEGETDPERKQSIAYIRQSNDHLINMTGALIELADSDKGVEQLYRFERVSLADVIREVATGATGEYAEKKVSLVLGELPADIFVQADKDKLVFVLQTLIDNACSYTPEGGTVKVSLRKFNGKAYVAVKDSGIGIAREDIGRIFSKFYRTKQAKLADTEGFGVGLYLAQSIARRHSGLIEVASEGEHKGTTFTVVLPLAMTESA